MRIKGSITSTKQFLPVNTWGTNKVSNDEIFLGMHNQEKSMLRHEFLFDLIPLRENHYRIL